MGKQGVKHVLLWKENVGGCFSTGTQSFTDLIPQRHARFHFLVLFVLRPPFHFSIFPLPNLHAAVCLSIHWQPCFIHNSNERHLFPFPSESLRVLFKPAVCQLKCQKKKPVERL